MTKLALHQAEDELQAARAKSTEMASKLQSEVNSEMSQRRNAQEVSEELNLTHHTSNVS